MRHVELDNPLLTALRACKTHFVYAAIFSGLINLLYIVPSIFMLQVYDRVVPTRGGATLLLLTVVLTVSLVVFAILDAVRLRLLLRASIRLEKRAAPAILDRILAAGDTSPAQRSQAMRDFDTLRATLTGPAIVALFDAPWAPIYIIISYLLHPLIGLLALLSCVLLAGVAIASNYATKQGLALAVQKTGLASRYQEFSIQSAEVVRTLGMRKAIVNKHLTERIEITNSQTSVAAMSGNFLAITKFLRLLLQSMALALGAWLAINQSISAGAIFAASFILGRALQPVEQILNAFKNVMDARTAYRNLDGFCRQPQLARQYTSLPAPEGMVELEGVTVRAPGSDQLILSDISFTITPGEIIALLGPSGAGKSTLLRVLAGALAPDEGEVRIDGARLEDWDREALARHVGFMPQTPTLFPATVHANISRFRAYESGTQERLDERVVAAATKAGAHELILRFPKSYDTMLNIGEGSGLSAGQRQMVALSRALFDDPKILFLDEPNAHLDMNGENKMLELLTDLKKRGATVVVSTHRTGLLQCVDKIMLINNGILQAFGTRDEFVRPTAAVGNRAAPSKAQKSGAKPPPPGSKAQTASIAPQSASPAENSGDA
ncbi:type I secretion system permease/ATPase [Sphingobium sp. KCTC 72723]|uniref:type I secretion system permease/ATPase n=1 Tax=Sphingobium sp. KCTC 72723 TaxID=2733867 RepID=UPI00165DB746|nr:type I secretion system permease/ATPase [Sphingobium sp. KCTC 72723]